MNGHNVIVLDINGLRQSQREVETYLKETAGFFTVYGISGLVTTYKYQKWLIQTIRKYSNWSIICGGGCATTTQGLLWQVGANYVVQGAGENKLPYFLSDYTYKTIDDIPWPDWDSLPMHVYLYNPIWGQDTGNSSNKHPEMIQGASVNTITSRGCPYDCTFCYDPFGKTYEQRTVSNVIAEIQELKRRYNIDFIGFLDDNMFVKKQWILEFCQEMKKENILWGCHARVNEVDNKILEASYEAGCRWIGYGIESGSQTILNNMNKKTTVDQAKRAIQLTRKYNIYPNTTFIYGYPGENPQTVAETIVFCQEMGLQPSFFYATPYPMTDLFHAYKKRIMKTFGGFEKYVMALGDAKDYLINLTSMSDSQFFRLREGLIEAVN